MKALKIILFIYLISASVSVGQTNNIEFSKTDDLVAPNGFSENFPNYMYQLKTDSADASLNYKIGLSYLNSRSQKTKAIPYLQKATASINSDNSNGTLTRSEVPLIAYKYLGDAYMLSYKFEQAIAAYEKFKNVLSPDKNSDRSISEELSWKLKMCTEGKELEGLITCPIIVADEDKKYFEEMNFFDKKDSLFAVAAHFYSSADSTTKNKKIIKNETTVATSVDGQFILIYKGDKNNGNLYASCLTENQWTEPERLSININKSGWESDEFISADGKTLYFSSDRAGGFGGRDIYICKKLPTGEWGKALNLGPLINSAFDEQNPFIYPDGVSLYFNSNRFKNEKEFDIYTSIAGSNGTWQAPVNVGYPVNNTKDDNNYMASTDNKIPESSLLKKERQADKDTYIITFFDTKHTPLTLLKGSIVVPDGKILKDPEIMVRDNQTQENLGIYHCNKKAEYMFILPQGRNINITYEAGGCLFYSLNINTTEENNYYQKNEPIFLQPPEIGSKIVLNNIFFEPDKTSLSVLSTIELENIFQLLTKHPGLEVEISGYINSKDSKISLKDKEILSKARALSVENYLVEKGINKERLIASGYGKPEVIRSNNDQKEKPDHWIELKILKIK